VTTPDPLPAIVPAVLACRDERTAAVVDLGAVAANVAALRAAAAPSAVWAVVKADGYGHGAQACARAALAGGAAGLCVAVIDEGAALRVAGITAPVLVLSEAPPAAADGLVARRLSAVAYTPGYIDALGAAATRAGIVQRVHLKVDTGMHRVGAHPAEALALARRIDLHPALELEGVMTHLAVADEPDDPFTDAQLDALDAVMAELRAEGIDPPMVHAANSAGALAHARARHSAVRCGIAVYGVVPGPGVAELCGPLRPALRWVARVSYVKRVPEGDRISYGLRHRFTRPTTVATVPVGYADGVPRRLHAVGGEVLIGGRRRRIVGVVTMDQLMADCGDDPVAPGDEVVLLGDQGSERVSPEEWGERLGTIGYEIVCGIGARVPRVYLPA